ncbi:LytR/AlgR family response regulator transcription factor [Reichenbachiella versicolor]|uniref:LytR/AlgR family response regulator transcription factor n=1 Tax=Reichenbachiella versicolor TaxID=1821036 RepID=UPI000D6E2582|nr:LytTR family transcriptional regulator DNA-binding domain-containing protein [Reichenbachiella versicolor]
MTPERIKVLIVEDEILLAQDIALRLSKQYDVAGTASSVDEAILLLEKYQDIDILLLDIMLEGEQDGIDLAKIINDRFHLPFIFLTSHADIALVERAKAVRPAAYMLKPFNDREIPVAIELALSNFSYQPKEPVLHKKNPFLPTENEVLNISDRLFLKKDNHFQRVSLSDISLLEADGNYTTIYTQSDQYIYSTLLRKMEEKLPSNQFIRVHRSFIINIDAVNGFEGNLLFIQDKRISVAKQYRETVFSIFSPF